MKFLFWISLFKLFISTRCFLYFNSSRISRNESLWDTRSRNDSNDPGTPLFLTPYIENGKIDEGRKLSRVPFTESLNIKSYSGFFTVDKKYDSNLYLWYFPPIETNNEAPVIVWLQGGPGSSSLYGLFVENGPLKVVNDSFQTRDINWALHNHMIYIDNPVGTGFSFTNDTEGFCKNETRVGEHLYSTIIQFLHLFPELQKNNFFITGESYAGKYIPAFAYTIHKKNPTADLKVNLKGMAIGDGLTDPVNQLVYSQYFYEIGLLDEKQAGVIKAMEMQVLSQIHEEQWCKAGESFNMIINQFVNLSGDISEYNYLEYHKESTPEFVNKIEENSIRKDIHVGSLAYNFMNNDVYSNLTSDITHSVADWLSELLNHYTVVAYTGQLDIIIPYPSVVNYLQKLKFDSSDKYPTAERHIWKVDGEIAGYVKIIGHLVEVLVRNAGHMVPKDQPKWALDLISKFTMFSFDNLL